MEWSYQLLEEREQRVFPRAVDVPGHTPLEAAEAIAGQGAGGGAAAGELLAAGPPPAGPDGRSRYVMLETLRAYGSGLLADAGEQDGAAVALGTRWRWPSGPREGCRLLRGSWPRPGGWMPRMPPWPRCWPGPWIMMRGSRCGWRSRWRRGGSSGGGSAAQYLLLGEVAGRAEPGSAGWCAARSWLGTTARFSG